MVHSERKQLSGIVLNDESLIGAVKHDGKRERGSSKATAVIAVQLKEPKGFGGIRMRHIHDAPGDSLTHFVCHTARLASIAHTDGCMGCHQVQKKGYLHQTILQYSMCDPAHASMPGIHRVASLLNR